MKPESILKMLRWFVPEELLEELEGDLRQRHTRDVQRHGRRKALLRLWWNTIRMIRPGIIFRRTKKVSSNYTPMFRNYFKMAVRNLAAHRSTTLINMLGLTTGIAAVIVVAAIIRYELSFDSSHTMRDRIYRVVRTGVANGVEEFNPGIAYPAPEAFRNEIATIANATTVNYYSAVQVDVVDENGGTEKKFRETDGLAFVDPHFFSILDFGRPDQIWLAGNPKTALNEFASIVLTRTMAKKYFGDEPALGRTLRLDQQLDCKVTGVVEDFPPNSDFPLTLLLSYSTVSVLVGEETLTSNWGSVSNSNEMYVLLHPGATKEEVEAQMHKVHMAHAPQVATTRIYQLQPLEETHRDARFSNFRGRTVSMNMIWTLAFVAAVMLALVCVNYVNLSTAQSTTRGKEIGMRKVMGSTRRQLIAQFLSESLLLTTIAGLAAVLLANLAMSKMTTLTNVPVATSLMLDPFVWQTLAVAILIVTLLAGFYPALVISGMRALDAFRVKLTGAGGGSALRKALVVFQFTATQVFVIAAFIAVRQMNFLQQHDLGFKTEAVIHVPLPIEDSVRASSLVNKLYSEATIVQASLSSTLPSGANRNRWYVDIRNPEQKDEFICEYQGIDEHYVALFDIPIVAGRNFNDTDPISNLIINEALASTLGFATPNDAIGHDVVCNSRKHTIVGVVQNFHANSLREGLPLMAFERKPGFFLGANIRLAPSTDSQELSAAIVKVEKAWSSIYPEFVFDYRFIDDSVAAYYREEARIATLLKILSGVLLIIACLGLFGLISFVVNRRMKEVAIRKVHGAGIVNILALISRDHLVLIVISFVLAAPLSYWIMSDWLSGFAYPTTITWWIMVTPGLLVLLAATFAVSGRAWKAARVNPVDNLKYE